VGRIRTSNGGGTRGQGLVSPCGRQARKSTQLLQLSCAFVAGLEMFVEPSTKIRVESIVGVIEEVFSRVVTAHL
jgi:hypothetical protein